MGIDFLDFTFRLEKKLGKPFRKAFDLKDLKPPSEWTVGYFEDLIIETHRKFGAELPSPLWARNEIECPGCRFLLASVPIPGFCRHCGTAITVEHYLSAVYRKCLCDALSVKEDRLHRDAHLIRDLGMG